MNNTAKQSSPDNSGGIVTFPEDIRSLAADDLDRVIEIDAQYTLRSRRGFFENRLAAALRAPQRFIFVGHQTGKRLDGFILAHLLEGEFGRPNPVALLDAIGVDFASRSRGIGRSLLAATEQILKHKAISKIATQGDWRNTSLVQFLASAGFMIAPRLVLERDLSSPISEVLRDAKSTVEPHQEVDFSDPSPDDFHALARDRIGCRSMTIDDLPAIIKMAEQIDGGDHAAYYREKMEESQNQSAVRVSLIAEMDKRVAGFIMARVDFGEFGRTEPAAVIDSIGVDRHQGHKGVGTALLSQLVANLAALRADVVRTIVGWDQGDLMAFFRRNGFEPSQALVFSRSIF